MKTRAFLLALMLTIPPFVQDAEAGERGSSARSGGNGGGHRATVTRDSGGGRDVGSRRDFGGGRHSFEGSRRAEVRTVDRSSIAPQVTERESRRFDPSRMPGGISTGTNFPAEARPRISERRDAIEAIRERQSERAFDGRRAEPRDESRRSSASRDSIERRDAVDALRERQQERAAEERRSARHSEARDDEARARANDESRIHIERHGDKDRDDRSHSRKDWRDDHRDGDRHAKHKHGDSRHWHHARAHWHDHDIRHFKHRHFHHWRHGHWKRDHHHGRFGWWWVVGPTWYFYSRPVYPYPNPYIPPTVVVHETVIETSDYWYYCEDPEGYYPYVKECYDQWIRVPAEPDAGPPPDADYSDEM